MYSWGAMVTPYNGSAAQQWQGGGSSSGGMSGGGGLPNLALTVQMVDTSGQVTRRQLITDALNRGQSNAVVAAAYP